MDSPIDARPHLLRTNEQPQLQPTNPRALKTSANITFISAALFLFTACTKEVVEPRHLNAAAQVTTVAEMLPSAADRPIISTGPGNVSSTVAIATRPIDPNTATDGGITPRPGGLGNGAPRPFIPYDNYLAKPVDLINYNGNGTIDPLGPQTWSSAKDEVQ